MLFILKNLNIVDSLSQADYFIKKPYFLRSFIDHTQLDCFRHYLSNNSIPCWPQCQKQPIHWLQQHNSKMGVSKLGDQSMEQPAASINVQWNICPAATQIYERAPGRLVSNPPPLDPISRSKRGERGSERETLQHSALCPIGISASNASANLRGILEKKSFCLSPRAHATATLYAQCECLHDILSVESARVTSGLCQVYYRYASTEMDMSRGFVWANVCAGERGSQRALQKIVRIAQKSWVIIRVRWSVKHV